jgi:hypothetical protein
MTAPSTWPRSVKFGVSLLAFVVFFLSYAAMCAGIVQLVYLLR